MTDIQKLKKFGRLQIGNCLIVETKKMVGNWEQWAGRFNVLWAGECITDQPISATAAIKLAKDQK